MRTSEPGSSEPPDSRSARRAHQASVQAEGGEPPARRRGTGMELEPSANRQLDDVSISM